MHIEKNEIMGAGKWRVLVRSGMNSSDKGQVGIVRRSHEGSKWAIALTIMLNPAFVKINL